MNYIKGDWIRSCFFSLRKCPDFFLEYKASNFLLKSLIKFSFAQGLVVKLEMFYRDQDDVYTIDLIVYIYTISMDCGL